MIGNLQVINRQTGELDSVECDDYEYEHTLTVYEGGEDKRMEEWIPMSEVRECKVYSKESTPYCQDFALDVEDTSLALVEAPITCEGCNTLVISDQ